MKITAEQKRERLRESVLELLKIHSKNPFLRMIYLELENSTIGGLIKKKSPTVLICIERDYNDLGLWARVNKYWKKRDQEEKLRGVREDVFWKEIEKILKDCIIPKTCVSIKTHLSNR